MMAAALVCTSLPMTVQADGAKIVTIGANLTEEQKQSMYQYFGTTADAVDTIEVTNADERKYMEGIASEAQIGTRTYSCSYVEPTTSGGIQVKVGNLTFVTSSMIASTLLTSGVENCNVVAASPMEVSGTGALTGIMMAYEKASGETLSEDQKAAATEELITTGEIADTIGQKDATDLINEVKQEVIKEGLTDEGEIKEAVNNAVNYNISLTEDQLAKINSLMKNISQYDYDVKALKETLDNLDGKSGGFFSNLWTSVKGFFTGDSNNDGGIINGTNDDILGADAVIDSTLDAVVNDSKEEGGFWDKVTGFFKNLFGGGDDDDEAENEDTETAGTEDETEDTDDSDGSDDASADDENPDASIDPETGSPVDPETGLPINDADNTDPVSEGSDAVLENQTNGTTDSTVNDAENNDSASDITQ